MTKISKTKHITKSGVVKNNPKKREVFNLPIQTAILVPSTKDVSGKISQLEFSKRIDRTKRFLGKLFGGYTAEQAVGGYTDSRERLVQEDIVMVVSYATTEKFKANKIKMLDWCRDRAAEWGQEAIGVIIENDMMYVSWKK